MPSEPWIWGVLIICGAVVVALAIWKGRGIKISKDSLEVAAASTGEAKAGGIIVAAGAKFEDSTVGNITGVSSSGGASPAATPPVDVLGKATVRGSHLGDVTGIKQEGGAGRTS